MFLVIFINDNFNSILDGGSEVGKKVSFRLKRTRVGNTAPTPIQPFIYPSLERSQNRQARKISDSANSTKASMKWFIR